MPTPIFVRVLVPKKTETKFAPLLRLSIPLHPSLVSKGMTFKKSNGIKLLLKIYILKSTFHFEYRIHWFQRMWRWAKSHYWSRNRHHILFWPNRWFQPHASIRICLFSWWCSRWSARAWTWYQTWKFSKCMWRNNVMPCSYVYVGRSIPRCLQ